ncbi:hypothetical protein C1H46_001037 [Malus baccata]|uniref:Uncharacterized protein n=1 Tax=Malus baccata TaxID=106549 RepID=A0A540NSC8_MALBA|nr:hypothetical protein C1H46_001037 [Malus baccata]
MADLLLDCSPRRHPTPDLENLGTRTTHNLDSPSLLPNDITAIATTNTPSSLPVQFEF